MVGLWISNELAKYTKHAKRTQLLQIKLLLAIIRAVQLIIIKYKGFYILFTAHPCIIFFK